MTFARPFHLPSGAVRTAVRGVFHAAALGALVALAACASPASRFYTLNADGAGAVASSASTSASTATGAGAASVRSAPNPSFLIEVPPVDVPPQVAKNQLVVQTGATQVKVLEDDRWASLPGDEIRRALSTSLTQQLGTIDVYGTAYPEATPVYRVSLNVQRFESWPGSHALIDAVWSVRAVKSTAVMTCRSVVSQPVGSGFDALVDGHRVALQQISTQIASAVVAFGNATARAGGKTVVVPGCPVVGG